VHSDDVPGVDPNDFNSCGGAAPVKHFTNTGICDCQRSEPLRCRLACKAIERPNRMGINNLGHGSIVDKDEFDVGCCKLLPEQGHDAPTATARTVDAVQWLHDFGVPWNLGIVASPSALIPSRCRTFRTVIHSI